MLSTERILLRPWRESDAETLYRYASDPDVGPRAGWAPHQSVEESLEIIRTVFHSDHIWAITLTDTDEPIGCIGYMTQGESNIGIGDNDAEVGYWVAKPYWNRGICTEALRLLIGYCWNVKGFDCLWADFFIDNPASRRVMEKCGFVDTGRFNYCSQLYGGDQQPVHVMKLEQHIVIRPERPEDYREVENLTREAFWNVYAPGCVEHYVLNQYRDNPDFIPELDFVMEERGRIIGHVMYSKAEITREDGILLPAWTFGPISIHPDYKRQGYGLRLLNYSLAKAREQGVGVLCMEGNIDFYRHGGFVLASSMNIHYHAEPKEADVPYFLAQELIPGYLDGVEGTYHTPKGYYVAFDNPQAFEAYEATFPPKEKQVHEGQLVDDCTQNPNEK